MYNKTNIQPNRQSVNQPQKQQQKNKKKKKEKKDKEKKKKKDAAAPPPVPPCGPNSLTPSHTFFCYFFISQL